MASYRVFYSWQSDLEEERNRYFLESVLEQALKELKQKYGTQGYLDQDTRGLPGSPNISDEILKKIGRADIFVADVSLVASSEKRRFPNPNVLIELGYAVSAVGWEGIILVFNEAHGELRDLPFDIGHKRHVPFTYGPGDTKPPQLDLRGPIRGILDTEGEIRWTTAEGPDAAAADPSAFVTGMPNRLTWKPGGLEFPIKTPPGYIYFAFPMTLGKASIFLGGMPGPISEIKREVPVVNGLGRSVHYVVVRTTNWLGMPEWIVRLNFF